MSQIKLISECYVKPKYEVEASKKPYYLAPVDLWFLGLEPMQKGLLFACKPEDIESDLLDKLKMSMSISLIHFYPLAGQLVTQKFDEEHACLIYVDCNKGPGAQLIHAKTTMRLSVSDIVSSVDVHPIVHYFFDLGEKMVDHDSHTRPLLSIQVTELLDGVFIGFTMNHAIGDGVNLWQFISSLSEIFHQILDHGCEDVNYVGISRKPIYKPFFLQGHGPVLKLPYLEPTEFVHRFDPGFLRERIFHFSPHSVSMLKAKASRECGSGAQYISSFEALCAFLWRSITRARNLEPDLETSCTLAVNFRGRLKPPLPEDHFGNAIIGAQCSCQAGELLSNSLGWVAMLVHQSVAAQDDNTIRDWMNNYVKAPFAAQTGTETAYYKPNSVLIGGSAKFDMYGPEFGLGRAIAILAGFANKDDGKVNANPGCQGGGSIDLEVSLKPEIMNALELDEEFMSFVS